VSTNCGEVQKADFKRRYLVLSAKTPFAKG